MASTKQMDIERKIKELKTELHATTQAEMYDEMATQLHNMYNSLLEAGFTQEQAWELTKTIVANTIKI